MARDDSTFTDTLDGLLQFLCDAAETTFVLSWVGLWAYRSWLAGWVNVGIPVAVVIFALALAKTIEHATHGEQFHPGVWVVIISLDVLAGFAISRTTGSARAEQAIRRDTPPITAESAMQLLREAAERDDVAGMTLAIRQLGAAQMTEASETVSQVLQKNYGSASADRRGLALESIEALTRMRAASACSLLREISSKESDLTETAQRAVRYMCRSGSSPSRSIARRAVTPSQPVDEPNRSPTAALPSVPSSSQPSVASPSNMSVDLWSVLRGPESEPPAPSASVQCAVSAGQFWHRNGFDKPSADPSTASVDWSYENHYNSELHRCFIAVRLQTVFANGTVARSTEVSDADGSAGQPLATLTTRASEISSEPQVIALVKDGQRLPPTPENVAWFHALMSK